MGETGDGDPAGDPARLRAFPIRGIPAAVRPILEVVPLQTLAYFLAAAQGYMPGTVRYITKVITTETGFPA